MGTSVVVKGDPVRGTDTHNVEGFGDSPSGRVPYKGVGTFEYRGSMTGTLSDFVRIDGAPIALITSTSSLDPGESTGGKHAGPNGDRFAPTAPVPINATLRIVDIVGTGVPNRDAGSRLLTVGGVKVLLDGQPVDTCSGVNALAGSTVTAQQQDFVTCSV
jgi:hypothetical protein